MTPVAPLSAPAPVDAHVSRAAAPGFADVLASVTALPSHDTPSNDMPAKGVPPQNTPSNDTPSQAAPCQDAPSHEVSAQAGPVTPGSSPRQTSSDTEDALLVPTTTQPLQIAPRVLQTLAASPALPSQPGGHTHGATVSTASAAPVGDATVEALVAVAALHGAEITAVEVLPAASLGASTLGTSGGLTDFVVPTDATATEPQQAAAPAGARVSAAPGTLAPPTTADAASLSATPGTAAGSTTVAGVVTGDTDTVTAQGTAPAADDASAKGAASAGAEPTPTAPSVDAAESQLKASPDASAQTAAPGQTTDTAKPSPDAAMPAPATSDVSKPQGRPEPLGPAAQAVPQALDAPDTALGVWRRTQLRHAHVEAVLPTTAGDVSISARTDGTRVAVVLSGAGAAHVDHAGLAASLGDLPASVTVDADGRQRDRRNRRDPDAPVGEPPTVSSSTPIKPSRISGVLDAHA